MLFSFEVASSLLNSLLFSKHIRSGREPFSFLKSFLTVFVFFLTGWISLLSVLSVSPSLLSSFFHGDDGCPFSSCNEPCGSQDKGEGGIPCPAVLFGQSLLGQDHFAGLSIFEGAVFEIDRIIPSPPWFSLRFFIVSSALRRFAAAFFAGAAPFLSGTIPFRSSFDAACARKNGEEGDKGSAGATGGAVKNIPRVARETNVLGRYC